MRSLPLDPLPRRYGSVRSCGGTPFDSCYGGDNEHNLVDPVNDDKVVAC